MLGLSKDYSCKLLILINRGKDMTQDTNQDQLLVKNSVIRGYCNEDIQSLSHHDLRCALAVKPS